MPTHGDETQGDELGESPSHGSFWFATSRSTSYRALEADLSVDVVVVGAGIVGITTAALLQAAGRDPEWRTLALAPARGEASPPSGVIGCSHGVATTGSTPHPVGGRRDDLRLWKLGLTSWASA